MAGVDEKKFKELFLAVVNALQARGLPTDIESVGEAMFLVDSMSFAVTGKSITKATYIKMPDGYSEQLETDKSLRDLLMEEHDAYSRG